MRTTLIRTVSRAEINALAYQGILPSECHPQITSLLQSVCGEEAAGLLAEPVSNSRQGFVDWYVPFEGTVRRYTDLPPDEKERACATFRTVAEKALAEAENLMASADPQKVTRGHLLKLALCYPSEEDLYLVGDHVCVTCWGFGPGTNGAESQMLYDLRLKNPPKPPVAMAAESGGKAGEQVPVVLTPASRSFGCLSWLPLLFLFLLLLLLLFCDFGPLKALSGKSLMQMPPIFYEDLPMGDLEERRKMAENERQMLEEKLLAHLSQCRLPKKAEEALTQAANGVPGKNVEELAIPQNVQDTSFLMGRWLCATGLFNSKTQEPVQVEFVFDRDGKGVGTIFEKHDVCTGLAHAALEDGDLRITHEKLLCQKSGALYNANTILCHKNELGKTACHGKNLDGEPWNAVFLKIREE
ncbi:MAG: hypothetical protein K5657_03405 [Desulfovibrio sp.]|nr:hypothetical protein [Desulfovibrio sp.]